MLAGLSYLCLFIVTVRYIQVPSGNYYTIIRHINHTKMEQPRALYIWRVLRHYRA